MQRQPEAELMDGIAQTKAYAAADLANASWLFIEYFKKNFPDKSPKTILDLGCGPADITLRFADLYPHGNVHGLDGAANMLEYGRQAVRRLDLAHRVKFIHGKLGTASFPCKEYGAIVSNSFLHHLADPMLLWQTIRQMAGPGCCVMVMDLIRPENEAKAREMVDEIMPAEAEILRADFFRSLCAAYSMDEVAAQLTETGLFDVLSLAKASPVQFMVLGDLRMRASREK